MSVNSYRDSITRIQKDIVRLEEQINQETERQLRASNEAARILSSMSSSSNISFSTFQSKNRDIQRKNEEANNHYKRVIGFQKQRSSKVEEMNRNLKQLEYAEASEKRQKESYTKKQRDDENKHLKELTRELEKQRSIQREMRNSKFAIDLTKLPNKIKILFLASNPRDSAILQLDEEVREIGIKLRSTEYRDSIEFITRWAVRTEDLLQILNEVKPTIVHFSGHGDKEGNLYFTKENGEGKLVSPEKLASAINTMCETVQLVVYNACFSELQASMITLSLPAAIGMNAAVGDDAARIFAAQLYSSLGFGHTLQLAFDQARVALEMADIDEAHVPQLIAAVDVEPNELILVRP